VSKITSTDMSDLSDAVDQAVVQSFAEFQDYGKEIFVSAQSETIPDNFQAMVQTLTRVNLLQTRILLMAQSNFNFTYSEIRALNELVQRTLVGEIITRKGATSEQLEGVLGLPHIPEMESFEISISALVHSRHLKNVLPSLSKNLH
jgi:hypothetical protein